MQFMHMTICWGRGMGGLQPSPHPTLVLGLEN